MNGIKPPTIPIQVALTALTDGTQENSRASGVMTPSQPCALLGADTYMQAPQVLAGNVRINSPLLRLQPGQKDQGEKVTGNLPERLMSNGDINFWDTAIAAAAENDPEALDVKVLLERDLNRSKVLDLKVPKFLLGGANRQLAIRYMTASIYNTVVCEGATNIAIFMDDKVEEGRLASAINEEVIQKYGRFDTYGNYGQKINISDSSKFSFGIRKGLKPPMPIDPTIERDKIFMGVDVGGTNIKTVIMCGSQVLYHVQEAADREEGGAFLRDQIIGEIKKARAWARRHYGVKVESLGLTFPSPIKYEEDGSFRIIRLTNYERYWSRLRDGDTDFTKDYEALNGITSELDRLDIRHVSVMNDANAFGFGEVFNRIAAGTPPEKIGIKVVLPIGTGPGYVKIDNGIIEEIPQQGGHMVIDLSDEASVDPGCGVKGCYGGYVPGSAFALRAKRLGIDISGRDAFVPTDMDGALALLADIAGRVATEAVKLHKITGADEIILAGGISSGHTGATLARAANDVIATNYPEFGNKVSVALSRSDLNYGGAIGVARYALAKKYFAKAPTKPRWDTKFSLPDVQAGKEIIPSLFDGFAKEEKKVCIITTKEIDEYLVSQNKYLWFVTQKAKGNMIYIDKTTVVDDLISKIRAGDYDTIVSIGAGKVTDWAKYAGASLGREVTAIPSTLSGNGPFTEKAIFYTGEGSERTRVSEVTGPPSRVILDIQFLRDMLNFRPNDGVSAERTNRAGTGDIVSIYTSLRDWDLAIKAGKERPDAVIRDTAQNIFQMVADNADEIRRNSDIGMIILAEALAEASLLNMRFGTSRPKDGSEHLLADEIDKLLPAGTPRLHGEQVAIASLIMGYLYSTEYDTRAFTTIRNLVQTLGLPGRPDELGMTKEMIVRALQDIRVRPDKYTYFDTYGAGMTAERAEVVYETVFGSMKNKIEEFVFEVSRYVNNSVKAMFAHIRNNVVPSLDAAKTNELVDALLETKRRGGRVIVNAAGRIGEVAVFFQQKLRALGFNVDDFKEITPEFLVNPDDLILTFSGSGKTLSVVDNLKRVDILHKKGKFDRRIFSITAKPLEVTWQIGREYHSVMEIPGRSKEETAPVETEDSLYLPLSSTFEYSAMLYLEGLTELLTNHAEHLDAQQRLTVVRDIISKPPADIKDEFTIALQQNERVTSEFIELLMTATRQFPSSTIPATDKRRVYLFGLGQNNYVIRLFARRIQNIGFEVYVPGPRDIISAARKDDIAVFVSNSGARNSMLRKIQKAKELGCHTAVITADPASDLARAGELVIPISKQTTKSHTVDIMRDDKDSKSERHIKRMFELAAMFYLEGVSVALMQLTRTDSSNLQHVSKEWE